MEAESAQVQIVAYVLSEQKKLKEDFEDRLIYEPSLEEWLSRREKRKTALSTKGFAHLSLCRLMVYMANDYSG